MAPKKDPEPEQEKAISAVSRDRDEEATDVNES